MPETIELKNTKGQFIGSVSFRQMALSRDLATQVPVYCFIVFDPNDVTKHEIGTDIAGLDVVLKAASKVVDDFGIGPMETRVRQNEI